jgi:nucleoside-diphosphate-sugar epimerase
VAQKRAIVFGGAGFIGCHLLKRLAEEGRYEALYGVDIVDPRFEVDGVQWVKSDIRAPIPSWLCGDGPFEIFNLAATHTTPGHQEWEYYWTNVYGAINVCRFASEVGAERVLFTSTMMVYGPSEEEKDEDASLEPTTGYGRSKVLAEGIHKLWQLERPNERRLTIVRPSVIYGLEERGNFTRLSRALKDRRFFYPGRTDTIKACGYVGDLVSSMIYMQDRNEALTLYNFAHPDRYTIADICAAFSKVGGYSAPRVVVPYWLLGLVALGFETLSTLGLRTDINRARVRKLYESTNMVPKRLPASGFEYAYDLNAGLAEWKRMSHNLDFD